MMTRYFLMIGICLMTVTSQAQWKKKSKEEPKTQVTAKVDTTAKKPKEGLQPYEKVIGKDAVSRWGLFGVHNIKDKWYFEINDTMLNRPMLAITRYVKTAAGGGIYGGEQIKKLMLHWEKGPGDKIFMRGTTLIVNSPDSSKPIFQAVQNSDSEPIVGSFPVKSIKKGDKGNSYVIDVTDFFNGDEYSFGLGPINKQRFKLKSLQKNSSYINKISPYPINVEITTTKTYDIVPPSMGDRTAPSTGNYLPSGGDAGFVTMELNTSMILLPANPMRKRSFDSRVGLFSGQWTVYGEDSQRSDVDTYVTRWRLEPKNAADAERQRRGELIEPAKPIVYYIDPATPDKWKPYLKQGVDDWNAAFEAAGWKNAIRGEYWPANDTTMSLEDARFSVIRYFASDIQNAYGPNVHDPRTGEILESHIGWYHNVMKLLRNWYLVQAGATDPRAGKREFDDDLMGQLIRFVSSHEVGHTLGLRHNMGASSATPVEKLRDKDWVAKNGHTSSIMDYARFNYVAQPEDGVTDLFPRIGDYDKWAIKWGYSITGGKDEKEDAAILNTWTKEAYKNPRLHFGTEISQYDPRYQTEDLGDNAMKASAYGIKNLQRILPKLIEWSAKDGESYTQLEEMYGTLVDQFRRYMGHVAKNVGGVYDDPMTSDMEGQPFRPVPKSTQKEAVTFLNQYLFTAPLWLADQNIISKIRPNAGVDAINKLQTATLSTVLSGDKLIRLMEFSGTTGYSVDDLLNDLEANIIQKQNGSDIYQRNLQKAYVSRLISLLNPGSASSVELKIGTSYGSSPMTVNLNDTDVPSIARGHLEKISQTAKLRADTATNASVKYHYKDIQARIAKALKGDK